MKLNGGDVIRLVVCLTAFLLADLPAGYGQARPYRFSSLTVNEGLSHTDANDIAQDKKGFIWIATYFGLDRFDGYSVKQFYNDNFPIDNAFKNRIHCIYTDEDDNIWLGTEGGLQRFDPKTEKYTDYDKNPAKADYLFERIYKRTGNVLYGLANRQVRKYYIKGRTFTEQKINVPAGVLLTGFVQAGKSVDYMSSNRGLWRMNATGRPERVNLEGLSAAEQNFLNVSDGGPGELVLTGQRSIYLIRTVPGAGSADQASFRVIRRFDSDAGGVKDILKSRTSEYWINTGAKLLRLDKDFKLIQTLDKKSGDYNLNADNLVRAFIDRTGCLWVCTFGGGINFCDLNQKLFYTLQHNSDKKNSLSGDHIRSILEDKDDLWIGTNSNGLNRYNLKTQKFTYFNSYNTPVRLKNDAISALVCDNDNNLWIGTYRGIDILRPDRQTLWAPPGSGNFPDYVVETLAKDYFGNIWFGNHTNRFGVIWKDKKGVYHVKYYGEGYFIFADKHKPQLFVSSTKGLNRILVDREGNIRQTFHYKAGQSSNSLSSNYTYPVYGENDSTYWIGTIGGGLNRLHLNKDENTYRITAFNKKYGIFKDVETLELDNAGRVWMGGNGLESLNPLTGKLTRYDKTDGLQGNSFKVGASYKSAGGRLYFGGIHGLNYFFPEQIQSNKIPARPKLTDILINNQKPVYGNAESPNYISNVIGDSESLTLNYKQNNFVIFFSSMHFANPLKCRYRYKLIGFDKEWRFTDGRNPSAAYSNLDYDRYTFVVEATNNDGIWSSSVAQSEIHITPPWWKSNLSKSIYALLIVSGLAGLYIFQARWYRLKREMAVREINERKREEIHLQREELYKQQLLFFNNVSHEFRTPLTLIMGSLEDLMGQNHNPGLNYYYALISRNARRLGNLISELMNFKKVSDSIIKLKVRDLNISAFCRDLTQEFRTLAVSKGLKFTMTDHTKSVTGHVAPFDVQILEKILFNLLSNSFKYTNPGGEVSFDVFFDIEDRRPAFDVEFKLLNDTYRAKRYVYFRVADTGIGISNESITRIFDRYYRISRSHLGSGVGLALVKSLTQLHKGDIYVYSERYKGTEIIIGIPWGEENYTESERASTDLDIEIQLEPIDTSILAPMPEQRADQPAEAQKSRKRVLIVDDNDELRIFLTRIFEKRYRVYEAKDGNAALSIVMDKFPELIISDVMMPGMSGIELCKLVKEREDTRHIPFIILSAKDALDTKIEGMESGADFYFSKPLSIKLLELTVQNIFEQRETVRQKYMNTYLSEATELVYSEKDKEFFEKLLGLIDKNMEIVDVDFLCSNLHVSRTKLYQKIKNVTDQSVGDLIRTIRLSKAVQIMTHEDVAISEVVERVGFQSSSNFSRAFKKEYGKSPLQFLQSLRSASRPQT